MDENKKLCIGLFSGSIDRLTSAGVILAGAAADDMEIEVFVLVNAARAFKKEIGDNPDKLPLSDGNELKADFVKALEELNVSTWVEFFEIAKDFTSVKVHICSLAGKIWKGEKLEDFVDVVDDICGIGEYLTAAEEADLHITI